MVVGQQSRLSLWHHLIEFSLHRVAEGDQRLPFLGDKQLIEHVDVSRVNGEEASEIGQPLGQSGVEWSEAAQVLGDTRDLGVVLAQQPLRDHESDVLASNGHLDKAILDAAQLVRDKRKTRVIE